MLYILIYRNDALKKNVVGNFINKLALTNRRCVIFSLYNEYRCG